MMTGEGKTLVATLPVYLNALAGRGVHLVTVNDYLAKRDSQEMGEVYKFLGITSVYFLPKEPVPPVIKIVFSLNIITSFFGENSILHAGFIQL